MVGRAHRFHRWLRWQVWSPAARLYRLCQELDITFEDQSRVGVGPTLADYEEEILGALAAAWLQIEVVQPEGAEPEIQEACRQAVEGLVPNEEGKRLLRASWRGWLLYLQGQELWGCHE